MSRRDLGPRRLASMPTWETLEEPNESDDEDDYSATSSQFTRSSVAPSTVTSASAATIPRPQARPPASTQPASSTTSSANPSKHGKETLSKLNIPGKQQTQSAAAGDMPPPTQATSQAGKKRALAFPSTQPNASNSNPSFSVKAYDPTRRQASSGLSEKHLLRESRSDTEFGHESVGGTVKDVLTRRAARTGHTSKDKHGLKDMPTLTSATAIKDAIRVPAQSQPSWPRTSTSQPRPRLRNTGSVSAPGPTQLSKKALSTSKAGKGKEKVVEVINLEDSDEDSTTISQSQGPPRPKPWKKAESTNPPKKSPTIASFTQKQPAPIRATTTSSGEEFPALLSQEYHSPSRAQSQKKSSASSSSSTNRARREEEESDAASPSSISQASRKLVKSDDQRRSTLSSAASREKELKQSSSDKLRAISNSSLKSIRKVPISASGPSLSQVAKRATNRDAVLKSGTDKLQKKGKSANVAFSSTQPTSLSSNKAGPGRTPPSTQPASANYAGRQLKTNAARPKTQTTSSASKRDRPIRNLGFVELSDDDDSEKKELVIDLTLDDDDAPPSSKSATKCSSANQSQTTGHLTQPTQNPVDLAQPSSPPAVRPKPRVSAIPKEKMASRKPQAPGSRPLDVSRRRSDATGAGACAIAPRSDVEAGGSISTAARRTSIGTDSRDTHPPDVAAPLAPVVTGDGQDVTSAACRLHSHPTLPASTSSPVIMPLVVQKGPESMSADPNFDYDFGEPMDITVMNDDFNHDTIADNATVPAEIAPSVDVTVQSVDNEPSSQQAVSTDDKSNKAEETSTPIERARALRSPPISVQVEESQSEDVNEVDLLLGPSISSSHTFASELLTGVAQAEKPETAQRPLVTISSEAGTLSKPATLTDKLGMLDLSRLANVAADSKDKPTEADVSMDDVDHNGSSTPPAFSRVSSAAPSVQPATPNHRHGPTSPALTPRQERPLQSSKDITGNLVLQNVTVFEAGRRPILEPFNESSGAEALREEPGETSIANTTTAMSVVSSSVLEPALQATPSTSKPRLSEKQAKFNRAVSPGAMFVGEPTPNFMGMYFGSKSKTPPGTLASKEELGTVDSSTKVAVSTPSRTPEVVERVTGKTKETDSGDGVATKLSESNEQSSQFTAMKSPDSDSASESIVPLGLTKPSVVGDAQIQDTPSTEAIKVDTEPRRENSLSPKSLAELRIPDARPRRKLNIPVPTTRNLRAAEANEASVDAFSQSVSSSPVSTSSRPPSRKESEQISSTSTPMPSFVKSDTGKNSEEARASARKLKSLIPGLSVPTKADPPKGIPSPTTNVLRAASSSGLSLKPNSMPYIKKRMMEQTMQSKDTPETASPTHEVSSVLERSGFASVSQSASPKRLKSIHTINADDADPTEVQHVHTISPAVPVLHTSTSSQEIAKALGGENSGDMPDTSIKHASEVPSTTRASTPSSVDITASSYVRVGPNVSVAPYSRFQVARKSNLKRRPKPSPLSSEPSTPTLEYSLQDDETSSSVSQRPFRKRTRSISSTSSNTGGEADMIISGKRSLSKRLRIQSPNVDGVALLTKEVSELRESPRQTRRSLTSTASTLRSHSRSSASSVDPRDTLDGRLNDESESSVEQPTTPVTDLAGAVCDIAIAPNYDSKYPKEVDRYFTDRDYGPTWYRVDEIPKDLVNEVNDTPDWCKNPGLLRKIFESAIVMNTTEDEPKAPNIRIINDIDDEPTPPFEFYYTNRMYHGSGVPPPEYRNLQGCDCIGKCDPRSKTCACVKRQREIFEKQENSHKGFVYDEKGRVQIHEYPIFECNDACGCTEDCVNRVVQLGRKCHVDIVKTKKKGWGVFAGKKIYKGTFIGIYAGEILVEAEALKRGFVYNKLGKTYLFDIDFWHIKDHPDDDSKYCIDAFHVGNFTRFLNHSCDPNCRINAVYINEANIEKALLGIFAVKDIEAGQEICFNYYGDVDEELQEADQSYQKCYCGARKCFGRLFSYGGTAPEEGLKV